MNKRQEKRPWLAFQNKPSNAMLDGRKKMLTVGMHLAFHKDVQPDGARGHKLDCGVQAGLEGAGATAYGKHSAGLGEEPLMGKGSAHDYFLGAEDVTHGMAAQGRHGGEDEGIIDGAGVVGEG